MGDDVPEVEVGRNRMDLEFVQFIGMLEITVHSIVCSSISSPSLEFRAWEARRSRPPTA